MASARQDWVDAARGLAIILVVIGHAWRGIAERGLIPSGLFEAVDARIYAFHMSVFFALSGLFFTTTLARAGPASFVQARVIRLIWPMVLWTYLFLAFKLTAGSFANDPIGVDALLVSPFPGQLHLWFLWALFLQQIAFLTAKPLIRDGRFPAPVLAGLALLALALALMSWSETMLNWAGEALFFAPAFVLGILLGHERSILTRIFPWLAFAVFAALLTVWTLLPDVRALQLAGSLALTFLFMAVFAGLNGKWPAWLVRLGIASMTIYLAHTIFSAAAREALIVLGIHDLSLHMLIGTAVGIVAPLLLLALARRTGTVKLLGL